MTTRADAHQVAQELARGLTQLWTLDLLSEGGRGTRLADRMEVARDAFNQTHSGALAGYGASDTNFALEVWRMVQRLFEGGSQFPDMDNSELTTFFDKLRKMSYGPQISHAMSRWLPARMFNSAQYTVQYLEKVRPSSSRNYS
jgi:hypothetical protein